MLWTQLSFLTGLQLMVASIVHVCGQHFSWSLLWTGDSCSGLHGLSFFLDQLNQTCLAEESHFTCSCLANWLQRRLPICNHWFVLVWMFSFGFIGDFSSLQIHYDCLMVLHEIPARVRVYTACCCDLCCPIGMGPHARLKSTSVSACCQDLLSHRNGTPPPPARLKSASGYSLLLDCCPIGMGGPPARLNSANVYSLLLRFAVPSEWEPHDWRVRVYTACCWDLLSRLNGTPCKTKEFQCIQLVAANTLSYENGTPATVAGSVYSVWLWFVCPVGMGPPATVAAYTACCCDLFVCVFSSFQFCRFVWLTWFFLFTELFSTGPYLQSAWRQIFHAWSGLRPSLCVLALQSTFHIL